MNTREVDEAREANWHIYQMALADLRKKYDPKSFEAMTMALKNMVSLDKLHEENEEHHYSKHAHENNASMADYSAQTDVIDIVPKSHADEGIQGMLRLFVEYSKAKDAYRTRKTEHTKQAMLEPLEKMLKMHGEVVREVMSCTDCEEERALIYQFMAKMREMKHA